MVVSGDIRKIQKTGKMHYVYLPTSWCKKYKINQNVPVTLTETADGSLNISSGINEKKGKDIVIKVNESDPKVLEKIIVACYINPAKSFKILLNKDLSFHDLMNPNLLNIELIEIGNKTIFGESNILIENPHATLRSMIRRLKTLIFSMVNDFDKKLIEKYEEEIDKSKNLIERAVISALTMNRSSKLKPIDLYYISRISMSVERMADHIITFEKKDLNFLEKLLPAVDSLKSLIEKDDSDDNWLTPEDAINFIRICTSLDSKEPEDIKSYSKMRVNQSLIAISETLMDWAMTKQVESAA